MATMELSPDGIAVAPFPTRSRGYDRDAVRRYLSDVAASVSSLEARLAEAERLGRSAREQLEAIEGRAAEIERAATNQARLVVADAERRAADLDRTSAERAAATIAAAEADVAEQRRQLERWAEARIRRAELDARAAAEAEQARHEAMLTDLAGRIARATDELDALVDERARHEAALAHQRRHLGAVVDAITRALADPSGFGNVAATDPVTAAAVGIPPADDDVAAELAELAAEGVDTPFDRTFAVADRVLDPDDSLGAAFFDQPVRFVDDRWLPRADRRSGG